MGAWERGSVGAWERGSVGCGIKNGDVADHGKNPYRPSRKWQISKFPRRHTARCRTGACALATFATFATFATRRLILGVANDRKTQKADLRPLFLIILSVCHPPELVVKWQRWQRWHSPANGHHTGGSAAEDRRGGHAERQGVFSFVRQDSARQKAGVLFLPSAAKTP